LGTYLAFGAIAKLQIQFVIIRDEWDFTTVGGKEFRVFSI